MGINSFLLRKKRQQALAVARLKRFFTRLVYRVFRPIFINGSFLDVYVTQARRVNVQGLHGTGKTAGSVLIAYRLWEAGYVEHIVSNIPIIGMSDPNKVTSNFVMILDESHLLLHSRRWKENDLIRALADLRRRNAYLISPTVEAVDKMLRDLVIFGRRKFGNLYWHYEIALSKTVDGELEVIGWFGILFPWWVFDLYPYEFSATRYGVQRLIDLLNRDFERDLLNDEVLKNPRWAFFNDYDMVDGDR